MTPLLDIRLFEVGIESRKCLMKSKTESSIYHCYIVKSHLFADMIWLISASLNHPLLAVR